MRNALVIVVGPGIVAAAALALIEIPQKQTQTTQPSSAPTWAAAHSDDNAQKSSKCCVYIFN